MTRIHSELIVTVKFLCLLLASLIGTPSLSADNKIALSIKSPATRLVYQRSVDGAAKIPISGTSSLANSKLEARLVNRNQENSSSEWTALGTVSPDGKFSNHLVAKTGWYNLEVRLRNSDQTLATSTTERVGVGEVFIVVGHSVAQGGEINLEGASDDRVSTIAWSAKDDPNRQDYERTGKSDFLPAPQGSLFSSDLKPAPFGHGTYFWATFAEHVAKKHDVPVLILNAGFGGTSLEHWAKAARGEQFEHSFVKSAIRMPYINLYNALNRYARVTGVRALLSDHGQNDQPDESKVYANYRTWIEQARNDLWYPRLAVVVNRQTPYPDRSPIRRAQERIIQETPHCFPGPDYDALAPEDRYDNIHLSRAGMEKTARLWADIITKDLLRNAVPFQPNTVE